MSSTRPNAPIAVRRFASITTLLMLSLVLAACASTSTDQAMDATIRTSSGGFSELSASLAPGLAEFSFEHAGSGTYEIDMSTDPNMIADVYANFGSGSVSPVVVVGGATSWDKYVCGATLYWRVRLRDTTDVSAIQTAVVCAANPFQDLSSALNLRQAAFVFDYRGTSDAFTILASTRPDMSGNLWTTEATRSPVLLRDPGAAWPGYDCGYILYWRVVDEHGVRSAIQEKHVCGNVGFSDEVATFGADGAVFSFRYRGAADDFRVDVSTVPDMSTDVYVGFGAGNESPIEVGSPQARWDKYRCDRTLYWQVKELSNGAVGEIHATTVTCPATP
ncbi:MAG: hypothetical protein R6W77_01115 [Trueperaceae bacterium]